MSTKIIRRELDQTLSVYNGRQHAGIVYCPTATHTDYAALPTDERAGCSFATETEAVAYLAST